MPRAARPAHDRCPLGVTGGKTASEYMFSELPQLGDIVRSAFDHLENRAGIADHGVLGPSHSGLSSGPTMPLDHAE
jgi:hypothetical protein